MTVLNSRPASTLAAVAVGALMLGLGACATASASAPVVENAAGQVAPGRDDLTAFPAATADQARYVIRLPERANEDDFKVELIVGRTQMVDCNLHSLGGAIETRTAQGWGYDYFVVSKLDQGVSTLMGCPDSTLKEAFVRGGGAPTLIRYNSRLPVVVYAPHDVEVRYRVWSAGPEEHAPR
ncbi:serine protease inhibitor ecotin [Brevundimonas sp.]|uniref:serine protease inhibitor ecotin n=1 Tax=Brevundimonas sp. TaxID=1871086 RepID=UPI003BAA414A